MVSEQPTLNAAQGEELLKVIAGFISEFLSTGNTETICSPVTLLNAARLLLAQGFSRDLAACLALGWLHWIRYRHLNGSDADLDAARRSFANIYADDPEILPEDLREKFVRERPSAEPPWEVWHAHARVLVEEFGRDHGERLLDHGIILYRLSLDAAPSNYPNRPTMEFNLGMALYERFNTLKETDDLDAAIAALQRAAQIIPDGDPNRDFIWAALADALTRRFKSTRSLADADAAVAAHRVGLPMNGPADNAGISWWFNLGAALWSRFELTRSLETLAEAIDVFRAVADRAPRNHPRRPGFLSALTGALLARYEIGGDLEDLSAALRLAENAVAEAPAEYEYRAELADNLAAIREQHARATEKREERQRIERQHDILVQRGPEFVSKLRPYVARAETLPPEVVAGAPEILPGVIVSIAFEEGSEVALWPASYAAEIARAAFPASAESGLALLRQIGIENLHRLPGPIVQRYEVGVGRSKTDLFLLEQEDRFVASRITFLDDLAEWIAPGRPRTHGLLVAIPRERTLLLHFPSGPGALEAFEVMRAAASALFDETPHGKLSPHVYYVAPDGHSEIVVSPENGGAFSHLLYGNDGLLR